MKKQILIITGVLVAGLAMAETNGREAFMRQQAFAEMQRVSGQVDLLQNNFDELQRRVGKLEGGGDLRSIRAEIDSLKAAIAELRSAMAAQRGEIVKDLSGRIAKMQPRESAKPAAKPVVVSGPHYEYTVQSGDSLFLVAKAFNTTVAKIRAMNNLKGDALKVGQKINVPKE